MVTSPWVNHHIDTVKMPNGEVCDDYHVVELPTFVMVLATKGDKIMFVQPYRYLFGDVALELPAGKIEDGETAVQAGVREFFEETGCTLKNPKFIRTFRSSSGSTTQVAQIVFGEVGEEKSTNLDENEVAGKQLIPINEISTLLNSITCGNTLVTLLLWQSMQSDNNAFSSQ